MVRKTGSLDKPVRNALTGVNSVKVAAMTCLFIKVVDIVNTLSASSDLPIMDGSLLLMIFTLGL